jgi:hypothetical protein
VKAGELAAMAALPAIRKWLPAKHGAGVGGLMPLPQAGD